MLQEHLPGCRVVKAYPAPSVKPTMFFCGHDSAAKATVGQLIRELGWEPLDVGGLEQALHLEHMTLLAPHGVGGVAALRWLRWSP